MNENDKKAILDNIKTSEIPSSHWKKFQENRDRENKEYKLIAERQSVNDGDMHKTFSL